MVVMKTLDKGKDKIKKICEVLREETLEPAKKEGEEIIKEAQKRAEKIIAEAEAAAAKLHENAKEETQQNKNAFEASLSQAAKQSIETLKQSVEDHFFSKLLPQLIANGAGDPQLIALLLNAIVQALQKEGISANLTAIIPQKIDPQKVIQLLVGQAVQSLKEKPIELGQFTAGAKIKLVDKKMTIDISDEALKDLLANHVVRKEFRKMFFE